MSTESIVTALHRARAQLLAARDAKGVWCGRLSASALSTATAVVALELSQRSGLASDLESNPLIESGLAWLAEHINPDGGWGDTTASQSNLSTTTLVWAAFAIRPDLGHIHRSAMTAAAAWLTREIGGLEPDRIASAILARYSDDRTFSVPILTHCALSGCLGTGRDAWQRVIPLPFELSILPRSWFAALQLPVVSYALPALIAVGFARHHHSPSRNPIARSLRSLAAPHAFRVLENVQPPTGGFLEAIPLTSFVLMSLVTSGQTDHPVARRSLEFLLRSVQPDGSWAIDTHLTTWVTTLSIQALATEGALPLEAFEKRAACDWLLHQQYRGTHPYTNAAPGGWAWTPLPGGVPDADDTAGALLALKRLDVRKKEAAVAAASGAGWLLDLQNRDGGIPTFCRGWGTLPFDRSSADITAHAIRAWASWRSVFPSELQRRIDRGTQRALGFLHRTQEESGAWCPLWFGNQHEPDECNRVYGTSRVLLALVEANLSPEQCHRAAHWLVSVQKMDGGWSGGPADGPPSVEETALAVEAMAATLEKYPERRETWLPVVEHGALWLADRVNTGTWRAPSPIGFYFAKLWYFEELYPMIWTVAALGRAGRLRAQGPAPGPTRPEQVTKRIS